MVYSLFPLFNALSPKDRVSRRVQRDVPYGPQARQRLDIYAPHGRDMALPVVFFVYGGSWMDGDKNNYEFAGRALAALGYVVVIADYRLIPDVEYPSFLQDCATAFNWTVEHVASFGGDNTRIALMGHSAGAYNAAMLMLDKRYLAAHRHRIRCFVGLSGPYDFFPFDGPISIRTFGLVPDPETTQPINHVEADAPPALLGTGDLDQLVQPRNSDALAARMQQVGATAAVIHYPKLGHPETLLALGMPGRWFAPVLRDVATFLGRHLSHPS